MGSSKSRPIWFKPSMPIMFILSAVAVGPGSDHGSRLCDRMDHGKRTIAHEILRTIARFSGFGLLVYGYLRFWDTGVLPTTVARLR